MKKLKVWWKRFICDHQNTMIADTQLKVVQCQKCQSQWWYEIQDLNDRLVN